MVYRKMLHQITPVINKRLQKLRRLNLKFMSALNNDNKQTQKDRQLTVLPISCKFFY
jgi:hypothetical protein